MGRSSPKLGLIGQEGRERGGRPGREREREKERERERKTKRERQREKDK